MLNMDKIAVEKEEYPLSPLEPIEAELVSLIPELDDLSDNLSRPLNNTERALSVLDEAEQTLLRMVGSIRKLKESPHLQE